MARSTVLLMVKLLMLVTIIKGRGRVPTYSAEPGNGWSVVRAGQRQRYVAGQLADFFKIVTDKKA